MMSGVYDVECDVLSSEVGVILWVMLYIFEYFKSKELEYSVKVTYFELYNEKIIDLFGASTDGTNVIEYVLMEDGKNGVVVKGLEEVYVGFMEEVFVVLNCGNAF